MNSYAPLVLYRTFKLKKQGRNFFFKADVIQYTLRCRKMDPVSVSPPYISDKLILHDSDMHRPRPCSTYVQLHAYPINVLYW